ncbi:hypothetical protein [Geopseudomonas aromaticivorans]
MARLTHHPKKLVAAMALAGSLCTAPAAHASDAAAVISYLGTLYNLIINQMITIDGDATRGEVESQGEQTRTTVEEQEQETRDKIEEANQRERNNQVSIYNEQVKRDQQPLVNCPDDQKIGGQIAKAKTQTSYNLTTSNFNKYNANEARNVAVFTKEKNEEVLESLTATCDPRIAPPISKDNVETGSGSKLSCTKEQVKVAVNVITGRKPVPQPVVALAKTDTGRHITAEIDSYNSRMSIIEPALADTMLTETDTLLKAYEKLVETPTVEQINAMSGNGAVERSELFQQQIETQLMIQIYKELMQQTRLLAVVASQQQEEHRQQIGRLVRNQSNQ